MSCPKADRKDQFDEFRGAGAHNYDRLLAMYVKYGGSRPAKKNKELAEAFVIVGSWSTDMRYEPGTMPADDAEQFLEAVQRIWKWADERL